MASNEKKLMDVISIEDTKDDDFMIPERKQNELRLRYKVIVIYFGDVNSTEQTFKCRLECWVHRELSEKEKENYKQSVKKFEPVTICKPYPVGCCEVLTHEMMIFNNDKLFIINEDELFGELTLSRLYLINCVWSEILELKNFPFDVQHFEMVLQFRNDTILKEQDWINFHIVEELCGFAVVRNYFNIVGWDLKAIEMPIGNRFRWEREKGFILILKRHWKFYIYRVVLVMFVVGLLSLSAFRFGEIDETISDRFGFISTMLLTVVAYMFIIKEYLPLLNYLTLLDYYVYFVLLFILIIAIQTILSSFITNDIDFVFFIADVIIWLIVHLVFIFYSFIKNQKENEKINTPKYLCDQVIFKRVLSMNLSHPNRYDKKQKFKKNEQQTEYCISYFMFAD